MIKLYTTHCPQCRILETKLKAKNIQYQEVTDVEEIIASTGMTQVPILEVDGKIYKSLKEANEWINNYKGENI